MIARRLTAGLAVSFIALCAWMYLRDRAAPAPVSSERARALADANQMLWLVAPPQRCAAGCRARVIGPETPGAWRIQLNTPGPRCFVVLVRTFAYSDRHGLVGLRSAACP